jgi:hypothetical protein
VTFNDRVGGELIANTRYRDDEESEHLYNLSVSARSIVLRADVTTMEGQFYKGAVIIGNNGSNGSTRKLISLDPIIEFDGTVDDELGNFHTLIARAVYYKLNRDDFPKTEQENPTIRFLDSVGATSPLLGLQAITGFQLLNGFAGDIDVAATIGDPFRMIGKIVIKGSVSTLQDQIYVANAVEIGGGPAKLVLSSKDGVISIYAGRNFANPVLTGGVKAVDGVKIALKGKFSRETANSFKASGVKFAQDNVGGFVDAALANIQSKAMDKVFIEPEARVVVGAAMKMKDGKISSFDETSGDDKSNVSKQTSSNCIKGASEECQK